MITDAIPMTAFIRPLFALLFACLAGPALAVCPQHRYTPPDKVGLTGDSVMIVAHASANYDARHATKRGLDEAVGYAKKHRIPVVYLQDDSPPEYYFMEDCQPDYWVFSEGGEVPFEVRPAHVYVLGGHLEKCMASTVNDILYSWAKQPRRDLTLTYLMDGIYSNAKLVEETDPFYEDLGRFMRIVTYGRPGGEHWPKLSLLETLGVINNEALELEYLKRVLPPYARTIAREYRVELQLNNGTVKILQPGAGWQAPTLRFEFVDSALKLEAARGMPSA